MCYFLYILLLLSNVPIEITSKESAPLQTRINQTTRESALGSRLSFISQRLSDTLPDRNNGLALASDTLMRAFDQRVEQTVLMQKRLYREARKQFLALSQADDPFAYYAVGYLNEKGYGGAGKLSEAQRWYNYAAQLNNPAATQKLISLYESGRLRADNPGAEIERLRKNLGAGRKRFTIDAQQVDGHKILVNLFAEDFPADPANPLSQEIRRIKEVHNATPSPEIITSFNQLYTLAAQKGISFQGLYKTAAPPSLSNMQNSDSLQTLSASKPAPAAPTTRNEIALTTTLTETSKPAPAAPTTRNEIAPTTTLTETSKPTPAAPTTRNEIAPTTTLTETSKPAPATVSAVVPQKQSVATSVEPPRTVSPTQETKTVQPANPPLVPRSRAVDYSAKALAAIQKNQLDSLGGLMRQAVLTNLGIDLTNPEQESKRLLDSLRLGSNQTSLLYYALGYLYEHKQSGKSWGSAERYYRYAFQTGYAPAYFRLLAYYTRETISTSQTKWLQMNYKSGVEAMPLQIMGANRPLTLYIHDFPQDSQNPISDECERLQETFGVAVPTKTIQRYATLYRQAVANNRSFRTQCKN